MKNLDQEEREGTDCEVIHIFSFLEPPERNGIGNAPAPAIGDDEPEAEPEEDVWFAEAAETVSPEASTVLVPEDVIRSAFESDEWPAKYWSMEMREHAFAEERDYRAEEVVDQQAPSLPCPSSCSLSCESLDQSAKPKSAVVVHEESDPEDTESDELDSFSYFSWRTRAASLISPLAMVSSILAIALSVTALVTRQETSASHQASEPEPVSVLPQPAKERNEPISTEEAQPVIVEEEALGLEADSGYRVVDNPRPTRRAGRAIRAPTASARETVGVPAARYLRNGRTWFDRGRYRTALSWYARAASLAPDDPRAQFGVALAAFELGDDELARRTLEASLATSPDHADSHLLLGFLRQSASDHGAAVDHYRRYLNLSPNGEWAEELEAVVAHLAR